AHVRSDDLARTARGNEEVDLETRGGSADHSEVLHAAPDKAAHDEHRVARVDEAADGDGHAVLDLRERFLGLDNALLALRLGALAHGSVRDLPAVDHIRLAGHERGLVRSEINRERTDVVGPAEAAYRNLAQPRVDRLLVLHVRFRELGL